MPANKVIKLRAISRHKIVDQPCIKLNNQQDALNYVHKLALIPVIEKTMPDGRKQISFPDRELQLLTRKRVGLFPICFEMQTGIGYLVLGLVPDDVITEFSGGGHFQSADVPDIACSSEDNYRDQQLARQWVEKHVRWVETNGIIIYD